jgi:hypothetical protein
MSILQHDSAIAQADAGNVDVRERLFNGGECDPKWQEVSRTIEEVTYLRGILFDIDPCLYQPSCLVSDPGASAADFYRDTVADWLQRIPILQKAEVRCSGRGLHVILWLDQPINFVDDLDRERWAARVPVIQSLLPIDPNQPGINAMTRKLGSVNSKNQGVVTQLKKGVGVTAAELLGVIEDIRTKPFKTLAGVLLGNDKGVVCPLCNDKPLDVQDRIGRCYACKRVSAAQLLKLVFADKDAKAREVAHAE